MIYGSSGRHRPLKSEYRGINVSVEIVLAIAFHRLWLPLCFRSRCTSSGDLTSVIARIFEHLNGNIGPAIPSRKLCVPAVIIDCDLSHVCDFPKVVSFHASSRAHPTVELTYGK